jgi:hypothetical protein
MNMMSIKSIGTLLVLVVMGATNAFLTTEANAETLVGTTSDPTGINGLVVDGTTYNVTFVNGSYTSVYSGAAPTFLGNQTGAYDATVAIGTALNLFLVVPTPPLAYILVPYEDPYIATGFDASIYTQFNSVWTNDPGNISSQPDSYTSGAEDFAVFTAAVPEPSTWAMMILGFAGIGFMAYRRKNNHNTMALNAA